MIRQLFDSLQLGTDVRERLQAVRLHELEVGLEAARGAGDVDRAWGSVALTLQKTEAPNTLVYMVRGG